MSIIQAIIQAIVQGLTEFLPVSSSGHLSLVQHYMGVSGESGVLFSIILHLGTLVAVFIAFRKLIAKLLIEFFAMIKDIFTGKFKWSLMNAERRMIIMLLIGTLPMGAFYFIKDIYTYVGSDNDIILEGFFFLITALLLFMSEKVVKGNKDYGDITIKNALTVGIFQGLAPFPGVSRSGSTIAGGLLCGFTRETAVQFSFLLGIPAILAGSITELKDVSITELQSNFFPIIIGFIVAAVVGFLAIKLVSWLITSNKFKIFMYYTFILGILVIIVGILEKIVGKNLLEYFLQF